jgi:hypothetical protein
MTIFRLIILFSIAAIMGLGSCKGPSNGLQNGVLIEHNGHKLTVEDALSIMPPFENAKDSVANIEQIKRQWIRNHFIIEQAEEDLPNLGNEIEVKLLQYKADLLRYRFENYYISQKINQTVSAEEIQAFYNEHKKELLAKHAIVKAVYIELSNQVKQTQKIKPWLLSNKENDQDNLKVYCYKNARVFDDFEQQWLMMDQIRWMAHHNLVDDAQLVANTVLEHQDDSLAYFILISDVVNKGQMMPIEFAKDEIAQIIINQRKKVIQNELHQEWDEKVNQVLKQ